MSAILLVTAGALCLARGLYRPVRALVANGKIRRCPGPNSFNVCDPSVSVDTRLGESCHAVLSGKVVLVGDNYLHIQGQRETVVVMYHGLSPTVRSGDKVSPGQMIGESTGTLDFIVVQFSPSGTWYVEPTTWLASRGCRVVQKGKSDLWCGKDRDISVPPTARTNCNIELPEKAGFALLPVRSETT